MSKTDGKQPPSRPPDGHAKPLKDAGGGGVWTSVAAALLFLLSPLRPLIDRVLFALLSVGPIPQHIGIIMDGNRRYARNFPGGPIPVSQGHLSGFNALRSVLEACLRLRGMTTVTVFAFAINNFGRDKSEVSAIMELAKRNLVQLAGHGEVLARHSVRLRMIGRKELLPADVRVALEKVERMTEGNRRATLNICIAYASSDEMAYAVERSIERANEMEKAGGDDSGIVPSISVEDLNAEMMLAHSPPVDILIRTSNVHRLSDFMLWQVRLLPSKPLRAATDSSLFSLVEQLCTAAVHKALLAFVWVTGIGAHHTGLSANDDAAMAGGAYGIGLTLMVTLQHFVLY